MSGLIYLHDVVTLELDQSKCNACGICIKVCPRAVLERNDSGVRIALRDACMECGACARNCEPGAISVVSGVGCAAAVIGGALGGQASACCCGVEQESKSSSGGCSPGCC